MFDLHLHSTASDGDLSPREVVEEAARRGLEGVSLTDHNGLWGVSEATAAAQKLGLQFVPGVEVTARYQGTDVHILGYSRKFDEALLTAELASTREGYVQRIQEMVARCQAAGFDRVSWDDIRSRRSQLPSPCYVSFDVARELSSKYEIDLETARKMTVAGGVCHVPYGSWALSAVQAVELVRAAGGAASLAHPGTIEREGSRGVLLDLLAKLKGVGLVALEVAHPFHDAEYQGWLKDLAQQGGFKVTGGSDWHGPDHLPANHAAFGKSGVEESEIAWLLSPFPLL